MPWSIWVVAALMVAVLVPFFGDYVAVLIVFGWAMAAAPFMPALASNPSQMKRLAEVIGFNPLYLPSVIIAAIMFFVGLYLLWTDTRSSSPSNVGILLVGILAVSVVAAFRVGKSWPG